MSSVIIRRRALDELAYFNTGLQGNTRRLFAFLGRSILATAVFGRQLAPALSRSSFPMTKDRLQRELLLIAHHYPQGLLMLLRLMPSLPPAAGRR